MKGETICGQFYGKMEKKTDGIDEVWELLDKLTENPDVCEGDAWIFPPAANDLALTPNLM